MTIPLFSREGSFPPVDALCGTLYVACCSVGVRGLANTALSCPVSPAFIDQINHPICLNGVNLQPATDEVFYVPS
jgi:hypothetical protein